MAGGIQMKLLLDTHIWIWTQLEPWRISSEVTLELGSPRNELWLSPLSDQRLLQMPGLAILANR